MPILVSVHKLAKSFAARPLFEELTFSIESGERIGLIGPNGAGKSTLLGILGSRANADSGNVSLSRGLRVGMLDQIPVFSEGATILSTVIEGTAAGDADDWESLAAAREQLALLPLEEAGLTAETPVDTLSGGWKKRVALARELARHPDLMLLDEPTNHLDVEGILWLEDLLRSASFATVTVTHDRVFLQSVSNRIIELDRRNPGGLLSVKGAYTDYLELKERTLVAQERREVILKNTLRHETEWLRQGAKARTTKQQARIHRAGELKDTVSELEYRNQNRTARIDFQSSDRNPKKLVEAKGISKSFDGRKIFSGLSLLLTPGSRVGLLGPNGCGKSTLIRTLVGEENPDTGIVNRSDQLAIAYFEQNRETLDPTLTVVKTICPSGEYVDYRGGRVHIKSYLDRFLFTQGQFDMAVGKLSGGEQSRLLIARLMLREANLLVLDEPTNDLDIATLGVLEECLTEFPGAILLVTHDRYFLDQVSNRILAFDPAGGEIIPFADLAQWETWHASRLIEADRQASARAKSKARAPESGATPVPVKTTRRKPTFKEQREWDQMEATIKTAEARVARLEAEVSSPATASDPDRMRELAGELAIAHSEVERLYLRWVELESIIPAT